MYCNIYDFIQTTRKKDYEPNRSIYSQYFICYELR